MCSWILMSIEYQIITLSLCLGALSLCGVKFPPILFHNVHNVSWMVLPMFSISHSHMGEYSWQWPCQCSNVHGWSCQSSWSSMMFFSSCCFSPRTAAAMSAAGALKIERTLEIWGLQGCDGCKGWYWWCNFWWRWTQRNIVLSLTWLQ